jgi:uncharacterized membrane protein
MTLLIFINLPHFGDNSLSAAEIILKLMKRLNGKYFASGFVIGMVIGVVLHSFNAGIAIGVVIGAIMSTKK